MYLITHLTRVQLCDDSSDKKIVLASLTENGSEWSFSRWTSGISVLVLRNQLASFFNLWHETVAANSPLNHRRRPIGKRHLKVQCVHRLKRDAHTCMLFFCCFFLNLHVICVFSRRVKRVNQGLSSLPMDPWCQAWLVQQDPEESRW